MKQLIEKYKEYIKFLGKNIDDNSMFLHYHNMDASDEDIKKGERLRKEIKELERINK